ncbi:hypothetical protein HK405_014722, partial [Cladochytrium tenue]
MFGDERVAFVASLMIAMKSPNGCCNTFTNQTWSKVSKLQLSDLNAVELQICLRLGFDLWMKEADYLAWLRVVEVSAWSYK